MEALRTGELLCSAGLEEKDGDLSKIEVDEVLGLVGDVGAEVTAHNAVPGWVVLFVELLLDERGDVLLDVVLLESLLSAKGGRSDAVPRREARRSRDEKASLLFGSGRSSSRVFGRQKRSVAATTERGRSRARDVQP